MGTNPYAISDENLTVRARNCTGIKVKNHMKVCISNPSIPANKYGFPDFYLVSATKLLA